MDFLKRIPFFIIHRSCDKEREPCIRELQDKLHIPLQIQEGVDGNLLVDKGFPRKHPFERTETTIGNIGCTASHIEILIRAFHNGWDVVGIFEDDAEYVSDCLEYLNTLPNDWDICFLGTNELVDYKVEDTSYVSIKRFWGTHAVLVKRRGMAAILEMYKKSIEDGYALPADWLYSYAIQHFSLIAYAPFTSYIKQRTGLLSTISGKIRD